MFSPHELQHRLQHRLTLPADAAICVAFSGGLDSTVLLHACTRIAVEQGSYRVRAVHVDHGLHADSDSWREHCQRQARALQVEFVALRVTVERAGELGLEAAARGARYGALRQVVRPGEYLLSAHHADDQLETLLMALMRGAGLPGLSAMQPMQSFASGWLARPLLDFTRAELAAWAKTERLTWLTDPSNSNLALDRNYLRQRIVAPLRQRWPAAAHTATRSSEHLQEAGRALEQLAIQDGESALAGECLSVERLESLAPARRRNLLRYWIRQRGARAPATRKLASIEHDMLAAGADRLPCLGWDGWEIRRHRGWLYCERRLPELNLEQAIEWQPAAALTLPAGLGKLRIEAAKSGRLSAARLAGTLTVRFRAGGESLQLAGDAFHRKLKKLLQASGVLPWWRARLPLVYCGDELIAVGDLWIAAECAARAGEPACEIVWEDRPRIEGKGVGHGASDKVADT